MLESTASSAAAPSSALTLAAEWSSRRHEVAETVEWELLLLVGSLFLLFIDGCKDSSWLSVRLSKFDERMLMTQSIFTEFTEVKVLAHAALVADACDW